MVFRCVRLGAVEGFEGVDVLGSATEFRDTGLACAKALHSALQDRRGQARLQSIAWDGEALPCPVSCLQGKGDKLWQLAGLVPVAQRCAQRIDPPGRWQHLLPPLQCVQTAIMEGSFYWHPSCTNRRCLSLRKLKSNASKPKASPKAQQSLRDHITRAQRQGVFQCKRAAGQQGKPRQAKASQGCLAVSRFLQTLCRWSSRAWACAHPPNAKHQVFGSKQRHCCAAREPSPSQEARPARSGVKGFTGQGRGLENEEHPALAACKQLR